MPETLKLLGKSFSAWAVEWTLEFEPVVPEALGFGARALAATVSVGSCAAIKQGQESSSSWIRCVLHCTLLAVSISIVAVTSTPSRLFKISFDLSRHRSGTLIRIESPNFNSVPLLAAWQPAEFTSEVSWSYYYKSTTITRFTIHNRFKSKWVLKAWCFRQDSLVRKCWYNTFTILNQGSFHISRVGLQRKCEQEGFQFLRVVSEASARVLIESSRVE